MRRGRRRLACAALVAALISAGAPGRTLAAGGGAPPDPPELTKLSDRLAATLNLPWPQALPPLPSTTAVQPHPVAFCAAPSIDCVSTAYQRLADLRASLGCDHRAVFATTYAVLTRTLLSTMQKSPHFFRDPAWLEVVDAEFVNFYERTVAADTGGGAVPEAWRIAFDAARSPDVNAAQDLLLGVNAHVQRDMPFVEAEMGLRSPDGASRKPDHDAFNVVLQRAYEPVVQTITADYDPIVAVTNPGAVPVDNVAALELVKVWREGVWRNAERLLGADTPRGYRVVVATIEANAAAWARAIATPVQRGYGPRRDAYCATHLRPLP